MTTSYKFRSCFLTAWAATLACSHSAELLSPPPAENSTSGPALEFQQPAASIWQDGVGQGFVHNPHVQRGGWRWRGDGDLRGYPSPRPGSDQPAVRPMWGPVLGKDHWYRGNFECRIELFGGAQLLPVQRVASGTYPHLRYNFATGTRWIPFFDAGAGVTATGIAHPDLGGTFEFNLQPGVGMHWFVRDNLALTGEVKYMHMSCAGIDKPNLGLNDVIGLIGLT